MAVGQLEFSAALVLGIGPALAVLFYSLRRFDRPHTKYTLFDDRRVFFGLAVGMVFGVIAIAIEASIPPGVDFALGLALFLAALVFEELFKVIYLNRPGYSKRFDTTFYGLSLGVGAASTLVVGTIVWGTPGAIFTLEGGALLALFSVNESLINADTGSLIGFGASRGELWTSFLRALGVRAIHFLLLVAFLEAAPEPWSLLALVTALAFAVIVYHFVYTQLLPGTLPDDIRREMRRESRARSVKD